MKKITVLFFAILMSLNLCACEGTSSTSAENTVKETSSASETISISNENTTEEITDVPVNSTEISSPMDDAASSQPTEEPSESQDIITVSNFGDSEGYSEMKSIILEAFAEYSPSVSYDSETALVNITISAANGTSALLSKGTADALAWWEEMKEPLVGFCSESYNLICSITGLKEIGCTLILLNDSNPDNALLGILNGTVYYDVMA